MCEVPLLIWPSGLVNIKELSKPYMTDIFPHTLMDLTGITSEIFDPTKSLVNDLFVPRKRIFNNKDYDVYYKDSDIRCRVDYLPEKLWVHRVNSIEKLNLVQHQVSGVEVDIVIKDDFIDVNHPPTESMGLSLIEYLENIKNQDIGIWLDIKTDSALTEKQLSLLKEVIFGSKIKKEKFILESTVLENVNLLGEEGFRSSFYIDAGCFDSETI